MKYYLFFPFLLFTHFTFGQLVEAIKFQDKAHDFGEVAEQNGPVQHEFSFVNKSVRPVLIVSVQPSCGCTTPGWSREPVAPGKTGFIQASFDPKGRPGYFTKTLTVTTDYDQNSVVLQIKGNVVDKKSDRWPSEFIIENGSLRLKSNSFNVGKVFINKEPVTVEFPFFNAGADTLKIVEVVAPTFIKLSVPTTISPNFKGSIKITYDAKLRNQYGFTSDNITIKTNDKTQPDKSISVYATVEEFFPTLSPIEQAKAPILNFETYEVDLGSIRNGVDVVRSIKFRNKGKKELLIRYAQSNCNCLINKVSKLSVLPNEWAAIELRFDPTGREGLQNKAVTIYSNDPVNPVQRITVKGVIENLEN
jgi:hypothetical protein